MENTFNFQDIGNLKIFQLGYVYNDAKKQAKIMESQWGMPPFAFMDPEYDIEYGSKTNKFKGRIGFSRFFNLQIELIQPISGESVYQEFLEKGREGLQHVSCMVDGLDSYIEALKQKGIDVIMSGKIGKQYWAYFDTEETFGIMLELQETLKRKRKK